MVTASGVCEILGVSASTLKRWRRNNRAETIVRYTRRRGQQRRCGDCDWLAGKIRAAGGRGSPQGLEVTQFADVTPSSISFSATR